MPESENIVWLTTQEVAVKLGVTDGRVRQFVQRGRLKPIKGPHGSLYKLADVEYFANNRRSGGLSKGITVATGPKVGRRRRRYK